MDPVILEILRDDIKELKQDVKTLLAFKWQIIGWSAAVGGLMSILVSLASAYLTNK